MYEPNSITVGEYYATLNALNGTLLKTSSRLLSVCDIAKWVQGDNRKMGKAAQSTPAAKHSDGAPPNEEGKANRF
jgi:hypothetical protein